MQNKKLNTLRLVLFAIVLSVSTLMGIVLYYNSLLSNLQDSACRSLDEVMQQEKNNFYSGLQEDSAAMEGYAKLLCRFVEDEPSVVAAMDLIVQSTKFEFLFFVLPDGRAVNNNGEYSDLNDRDYFHEALKGRTVISDPVKSKFRDANIIAVATPVLSDDAVVGVLIGSFNAEKLDALFMASFDGYGYSYIVTNSGEIIAKTDSPFSMATSADLFESFRYADFYKNDTYETMQRNLLHGSGGHSLYRFGGERRMMHYDKLGINDWNIFTIVNPKSIEAAAGPIVEQTVLLTAGLLLIFALLVLYNALTRKRFTRELTQMAFVDQVTGFRSFGKFRLDAQTLLKDSPDADYVLVKVDIENFKLINQMYSYETGDKVLKAMAQSLDESLDRETDAFGRIHADEFVLLISGFDLEEYVQKQRRFEECFTLLRRELVDYELVLPRGRYRVQQGETDFGKIFEKVNFAHRLAKGTRNKMLDFDGSVRERAIRELELEAHMAQALLDGEFQIFFQPRYQVNSDKMVGAEGDARWVSADGSILYSSDFLSLFERNGFIAKLDFYLFEKACQTLASWLENGIPPIVLSLNFSSLHLHNPAFAEQLREIAARYNVPCHLLELAWSESAIPENLELLDDLLAQLHGAGFTLALDGFGAGYSSLRLLRNVSVDTIKIDEELFVQCEDFQRAEVVIRCVVNMARQLGVSCLAQGVETKEQQELLSKLGCETMQGSYIAKPLSAQQLEVRLMRELLLGK